MFQKLVSHNADLRRLVDRGFAVAFDSNHLVVRDIPYLDQDRNLQLGAIVTKIDFIDQERVRQTDHQIFFAGSIPHGLDGKPIQNLGGGPVQVPLSDATKDVVVQRSFSNKPKPSGAFPDFYEKIESYVAIISGPAIQRFGVSPYTFRAVKEITPSDSVFKIHDTLTSRAEIFDLAAKFKDDVVAVIGLGGTGGYVLDFLVKTPVREIRGFDFDGFHVHTVFRAPGRFDLSELGQTKADVYRERYGNFRTGLSIIPKRIDAECEDDLRSVTFAFVCVDTGTSRAGIFDLLISKRIPFIDVGMGLSRKRGALSGMLRTTYYPADDAEKVRGRRWAPETDSPDDIYRDNIQIAELNALNACLAVTQFKQIRGFYMQQGPYENLLLDIVNLSLAGERRSDED